FALLECDGHDARNIREALAQLDQFTDKPKCLYAHTIKGRGVSYMEHTNVLKQPGDRYVWHNKPPATPQLTQALTEIQEANTPLPTSLVVRLPAATPQHLVPFEPAATGVQGKPLVPGFARGLLELARTNDKVIVLDADLEEDCGLTPFREKYPDRFFE